MGTRWLLLALVGALAAISYSAPATAAVSVGHSGWNWGNPLPQGNTIRGLEFVGSRGYAAGEFGTLIRTDDAGNNWTGIATGITADLRIVRVLDPNTIIIGGGCTLRRSDDAGQSFRRLPFSATESNCPASLASFSFPSASVGYVVLGDGTTFRTADGGTTFSLETAVPGTRATNPSSQVSPTDVFFTAADTGVAVTTAGQIYRTTDGADAWTLVQSNPAPFNGLYFVDASTGYAVGNESALFRTTDGGATWSRRALSGAPGGLKLTAIRCAGPNTCLITTEDGAQVLRTTDGGDTAASISPSTQKIFAAAFASASRVVAAGEGGATVVSDDAGVNYSSVGGRLRGSFTRLRAESSSIAYAAGRNGALARTVDGGKSWTGLGVPTSEDLVDVSFPNATTGFALDSAGAARRTGNEGASWQLLNTGTDARPNAILALNQDLILLIGPTGIRRSTNGGNEFEAVRGRTVAGAALSGVDQAGSAVFAFGPRALLVSTNRGASWAGLRRPGRTPLDEVDFVSSNRGFALDASGRLWRTTNRGKRWTQILSTGTLSVYDLAFSDSRRGYLALRAFGGSDNRGYVLRTDDAGATWRPQLISKAALGENGLAAPAAPIGFAMTDAGSFFATATGGDAGADTDLTLRTRTRTLRRAARIRVTGRLSPAEGGEIVVVSARVPRRTTVPFRAVEVASNGTFTTTWSVSTDTFFVAQWAGDDDRRGEGSAVLKVTRRR